MIDPKPGLGLPLMDHLVQQGVLHLGPRVPCEMAPADGDAKRAAGADLHCQLSQAGAHPAREPN